MFTVDQLDSSKQGLTNFVFKDTRYENWHWGGTGNSFYMTDYYYSTYPGQDRYPYALDGVPQFLKNFLPIIGYNGYSSVDYNDQCYSAPEDVALNAQVDSCKTYVNCIDAIGTAIYVNSATLSLSTLFTPTVNAATTAIGATGGLFGILFAFLANILRVYREVFYPNSIKHITMVAPAK